MHGLISLCLTAVFFSSVFWMAVFQALYVHFVKRAYAAQRVLENKYMGPEIRRGAGVIQYRPSAVADVEAVGTVMTAPTQMA